MPKKDNTSIDILIDNFIKQHTAGLANSSQSEKTAEQRKAEAIAKRRLQARKPTVKPEAEKAVTPPAQQAPAGVDSVIEEFRRKHTVIADLLVGSPKPGAEALKSPLQQKREKVIADREKFKHAESVKQVARAAASSPLTTEESSHKQDEVAQTTVPKPK